MPGLYREFPAQEWRAIDIICALPQGRFLVREVGPLWPGVAIATLDQVRVPGQLFEPRP